ncbi:MAG: YggT family protein [Solirubrobacteraceae bacterium]
MLALASVRGDAANYVQALLEVYIVLLLIYLVVNLVLSFGARPPYWRAFDLGMGFLRDVCEPYLRIFRRFIPPIGAIDLSPTIGIILLIVLAQVIPNLIAG